jgi:prophage regulatory protein
MTMNPIVRPRRIISARELHELVPYSPSQIRRLEQQGRFPKRVNIGPHRVGWFLDEIEEWMAARARERDE